MASREDDLSSDARKVLNTLFSIYKSQRRMPTNSGIGFDLKYLDEQMPIYESGISLERMKYLVAIDELRKRGWVSSVVGVTSGTSPYGNHNTFYFLDTSRFSEIEKLVGGDE